MRDLIQSKIGLGILGMLGAIVALLGGLIVQQQRQAAAERKVAACRNTQMKSPDRRDFPGGDRYSVPNSKIKDFLSEGKKARILGSSFPKESHAERLGRLEDRAFEVEVVSVNWNKRQARLKSPCTSEPFVVPFERLYSDFSMPG